MSRRSRSYHLLEKSVQAALSAIEIYNKPDFKYREESFAILMVNAWEMLLKAKILKDNSNKLKSLYVEDKSKKRRDGKPFKRPPYKRNRSGNCITIDIFGALKRVNAEQRLYETIETLVEIRDNSIHFYNESKLFEKKLLEIGTANLKSYVTVVNEWFDYDLSQYNFYLMPISFFHPYEMESFSIESEDQQHKNLLEYIAKKESEFPSNENAKHNISLQLETKFVRSKSVDALNIRRTNDENADMTVKVDSEDEFRRKWPWDYTNELKPRLKERYLDIKFDQYFRGLMRQLERDKRYCNVRYLDWNNPKSQKKKFYSTQILEEFDKYYTKK